MGEISQLEHWNGPVGQKWVDYADQFDQMLKPLNDKLLDHVVIQSGENVLDIGCGAGALTMRAAALAGKSSTTIGVDVSVPLVRLAKQRAERAGSHASFQLADAAAYHATVDFDIVVSRLGVMFFDDPVEAFANIREQSKQGAGFSFVCWQPIGKNPWLFEPIQAAAPFLKAMPSPSNSDAPSPFSLSDKDRISTVLKNAGWQNISIAPLEIELTLPGRSAQETAELMLRLGPIASLIREQKLDPEPIERAVSVLMEQQIQTDGRIRMRSASWLVSATKT